jgi:NTE family protein
MAYHAGALKALAEVLHPASADLVVGTSAGSIMGANLRVGWSPDDLWKLAVDEQDPDGPTALAEESPWVRTWRTPAELVRRTFGSAYVLERSLLRFPGPRMPAALRRAFPGGFYAIGEAESRLSDFLPEAWPAEPLWLVTVDICTGRRVVLGRPGAPDATLIEGVLASSAIPAFFQPIRVGGRTLVDGGVHSSSNLDLAARFGCDLIVGIIPMAYDRRRPPGPLHRVIRRVPNTSLAREVTYARGKGATVLLIRPTGDELRVHGANLMRVGEGEAVARAAYDATRQLLDTPRFQRALSSFSTQ